ncbi:MAG: winged helix-turn-helix domain-containing protein [Rubrivivax sp.]|nr:winged helix-turn-helix domain-containing protein [Rubrivivax sp.]
MSDILRCGRFELRPDERQLRLDGQPVPLGARAFDVLLALVERRERIVAKSELFDLAWPGLVVEENNLSVQISALRKLLGASAIVTVPGRGYRFALPIATPRGTPEAVVSPRPEIAVLPFETHGPDEAYFGDGVTEEIITALSANRGLFVIARHSTLRYRGSTRTPQEIAGELGVRYLVVGAVHRLAGRLRLNAGLVEAPTGHVLWSDHFDGDDDDLFGLQTRVAAAIAAAVDPRVEAIEIAAALKRPTSSPSAYDHLLRALAVMHHFDDGGFERAGEMLRRAIELDPAYARAHAQLAWWHMLKVGEGRGAAGAEDGRLALQLARRATELDPLDALALSVAGHVESVVHRNFDAALDLFEQALSIHPSCAVAWARSAATLAFVGRGEEAVHRIDVAMRLSPFDPLAFAFCTTAGAARIVAGRSDEAVNWLAKARRLNPSYRNARHLHVAALARAGRLDEAREQAAGLVRVEPMFDVATFGERYPQQDPHRAQLLDALRRAGLPG